MDNCKILVTLVALKCKLKAKNKAAAMNKQPFAGGRETGRCGDTESEREALRRGNEWK